MAEQPSGDFPLNLPDQHLDDPFGPTKEHVGWFCDRISHLHEVRARQVTSEDIASTMIVGHDLLHRRPEEQIGRLRTPG